MLEWSFSRSLGHASNETASKVQTNPHVTQCSRWLMNSGFHVTQFQIIQQSGTQIWEQAVVRMSPGVCLHQRSLPSGLLLLPHLANHQEHQESGIMKLNYESRKSQIPKPTVRCSRCYNDVNIWAMFPGSTKTCGIKRLLVKNHQHPDYSYKRRKSCFVAQWAFNV